MNDGVRSMALIFVRTARPRRRPAVLHALLALMSCAWLCAPADGAPRDESPTRSSKQLQLSIGQSGAFGGDEDVTYMSLDYRWRPRGSWGIAPGIGISFGDDGSHFTHVDAYKDFWLGERSVLTLKFGAGLFAEGDTLRLGDDVEFQTGLTLARTFSDRWQAGFAITHISNGGLSDANPGTEVVSLFVSTSVGHRSPDLKYPRMSAQAPVSSDVASSPMSLRISPDDGEFRSSSRRISSPASAR